MFAVIAAILFGFALLFDLLGLNPHPIFDVPTLTLAGFLFVALHLAGAGAWGTRWRSRYPRRRR